MVVWGGLRPIVAQVVVDVLGLVGFGYVTFTKATLGNAVVLVTTIVLTVLISGNFTNRWTIIFPMIPLLLLQGLRRISKSRIIHVCIAILSVVLILVAGALSVLFPAVEFPPLETQKYNVGVFDVFLPVNLQFTSTLPDAQNVCPAVQDYLTTRILYPTLDPPSSMPYLRPETSKAFCEETMKFGAPPPLQKFGWMLHTWRLTQIEAKRHAQPMDASPSPIIIYSPGLGGNAELYSYQTRSLAANGYVVVVVEHADGSAPVVPRKDGSVLRRNESVSQDWIDGRKEKYRQSRRAMTAYRAKEVLAAVETIIGLNDRNIAELEEIGLSFVGKLDVDEIHYMGHSFGGATSFHAARLRPPTSIIAHEPATEWIPDATRGSLFDLERLQKSPTNYTVWTVNNTDLDDTLPSVHDFDMLVLFSHEWDTKQWGGVDVLKDLQERGLFGSGASRVQVIDGAHHTEFSDTCMLTPTWLARGVGITGSRSPLDTAQEIHALTLDFLHAVRQGRNPP